MNPKWIDLTALHNPKNKLKSLLPVIILVILLILIPIGIYLVKQPQIFKPKAQSQEGPALYLKPAYLNLNEPVGVGEEFQINVIANSENQIVNEVDVKLNFDQNLLEVVSVSTTGVSPSYCGGIAGLQCPRGYSCLMDNAEGIADAMGTCIQIGKKKGNPKMDSTLDQLIKSANRQDLIRDYALYVIDGKVRVVLELKNKDFSLPAEFGTEEARYETLLQALVFIDKLNLLTENPDINFVRSPESANTNSNLDTQASRRRPLPPLITDVTPTPGAACKRTGCSGEICSDQDVNSTCAYREEYACYGSAECKRQTDGNCGWTMTDTLSQCLGKPAKGEGVRCDDDPYSCGVGLECRPICEANPGGFTCDAVGSVCKQPKPINQMSIDAKYDNSQGVVTLKGNSASGVTLDTAFLATVTFKALKPGKTKIDVDPVSVFLRSGNILINRIGLDVAIEQLQACGDGNSCKEGYYCDIENMTKYCAINDCPNGTGVCRPKPTPEKGDGNGDGVIDWADLSVLYSNFFKNNPEMDFNDDGVINSIDYANMVLLLKQRGVIGGGKDGGEYCDQVITRACTYEKVMCVTAPCPPIKVCKDFGTPCDVPEGWMTMDSCISEKEKTLAGQEYSSNQVIVGFNPNITEQQARSIVSGYQLAYSILGGSYNALKAMVVEIPQNQVPKWMCEFELKESIKYTEPNMIVHAN